MENFKVIEQKENPLFNRKEIQFNVQANITPSRMEIGKLISEKFSTQIENIKIKEIHGRFGSKTFKVTTFIYKSEQDKDKLEIKKKKEEKLKETLKKEETSETTKSSSENNKNEEKVEETKEDSSKNEEQKEVNSNK